MPTPSRSTPTIDSWWNNSPTQKRDGSTSDWRPTHRISWSDHQGLTKYRDVMLEGTNLYSKSEWDAFTSTDWQLVNGRLKYRSQQPIFSDCTIEALSR